jgi:hypothetical protein
MNRYRNIEIKLHQFTRKFYTNELIKGGILFFSLGLLYFFFTLFLESFLWLKPAARTLLFWFFILVETFLIIRFIVIPVFKLIGLRTGISLKESSKIIGNHFPAVADKLLNVLELKEHSNQSDLILASIDQKSQALQPIPFVNAIDFKKNTKYLKYASIPVLIWLLIFFTGNNRIFSDSLVRVVNHRTAYSPPAPFSFLLANTKLEVLQGKAFKVTVKTTGSVVPNEAKIIFNNRKYYLQNNGNGTFSYTFSDVQIPIDFYIESTGILSQDYRLHVIKTPTIQNISLEVSYPNYLGKINTTINNPGNLTVPQGTKIQWNVITNQTDSVVFINDQKRTFFKEISEDTFQYSKRAFKPFNYNIASSNLNLKDYESLFFSVDVIKDDFPTISLQSNIDSISRGVAQFAGQVSDDYGLTALQLIYYDAKNPQEQTTFGLPITKENIQMFFYQFPDGLNLQKGIDYEFFFQVFDNDGVSGNKKTISKTFRYRQKTSDEVDQELLQEQKNSINNLEKSIQKQQQQQKELAQIQQDLQNKKTINWNDKKKVQRFIQRQEQYKKMMQRQTEVMQENLDEKKEENENLQNKKEELQKRIEELKKLDKQQRLLDEIQKLAEKLNKDDLVKKAKELAQQNKQQERSLEKTLELVKRFYIEQKTMQITNMLATLSKQQDSIQQKEDTTLEEQKQIKKEFDSLQKELEELAIDNERLKEPMELPDTEQEQETIDKELKKSEENLQKQDKFSAKKNQMKSSKKMKEMSEKMQQAMLAMEGESMEENMEDLRKILENLVIFSFKQENLMNTFDDISTSHPDFGNELKKQNEIKTYFEHIDDSLYVLSMRLPKISAKIQDDLSSAHYNLDQSLDNFSENRFSNGISNQRYVMTAANNLADYLSSILNSMKNSMSMKMGKGKGKGKGFSLPDLIKKQGDLSEKMKNGIQKGKKPGDKKGGEGLGKKGETEKNLGKGKNGKSPQGDQKGGEGEGDSSDDLDGELYKIYKEQSMLRQQLQEAIKETDNGKPGGSSVSKKALKTMQQLENELLDKGFNAATLQKMQTLNYELLKLESASLEQGKENKRTSNTNVSEYQQRKAKELTYKKLFYNQTEILNRQSLPLQQNYKKKVREYFSQPQKIKE